MKGCYDCKYWEIRGSAKNAGELNAECRRYPPNVDGKRPVTNGLIVCGEWISSTNQDFLGRWVD